MATFVFVSLTAHGHINPTLPLVAELVRRGHRVDYWSSPDFQAKIEASGARFRNYPHPGDLLDQTVASSGKVVGLAINFVKLCHLFLPALAAAFSEDRPDCVIHDSLAIWGRLAAERAGLASVCSSTTMVMTGPPPWSLVSALLRQLGELPRFRREARRLSRAFNLPAPGFTQIYSNAAGLNLVYTARAFQPRADRLDGSYAFVGPSLPPAPAAGDFPLSLEPGQPLVYVSLGTVFAKNQAFFRDCIRAFAPLPWRVVISTGGGISPASLGELPGHISLHAQVPQLAVLARAALFITHGGMNSVHESLCAGVPMLVIPQAMDQPLMASLVAAHGAGLALKPRRATPERLRAAAARLLSEPRFAERALALGKELKAAGGPPAAADRLEQHLAQVAAR